MAKRIRAVLKIQLPAGQATPAPPVGPALGQHGVNIMQFVKEYNDRTANQAGTIVPVHLTVYEDKSFSFLIRTPPASELLRKRSGIDKGSSQARHQSVAKISRESLREVAELKMKDLTAVTIDSAIKIVEGTARSMGIEIVE